jgi:N-acetylglucosamine-6-phosphate deacetylase
MTGLRAFRCARIFDGAAWHDNAALVTESGHVRDIVPIGREPQDCVTDVVDASCLVPGFVDLQVNGGGGILFNNAPTAESIRTICATHARFGTTALLPTLITDRTEVTTAAIEAGIEASAEGIPGFLGLHLEGPHLSVSRKGTHDPSLIRTMLDADLDQLIHAAGKLPHLLSTIAPESVTNAQIAALAGAGITVSLGHSDASYATARAAFEAGATMVTHLFNAMSQLGNREPGVVGAALDYPGVHAGLIADGIHVHPASIGAALRACRTPGGIFLVTDAMSQTGTDITTLTLNGRTITRADGALRLDDGTLAGADLDIAQAVAFMHRVIGLPLDEALRMAALYPAQAIGAPDHGHLGQGARADFVALDDALVVQGTWISGMPVYQAA